MYMQFVGLPTQISTSVYATKITREEHIGPFKQVADTSVKLRAHMLLHTC